MREFSIPDSLCTHCGYMVNACVTHGLDSPNIGDLSDCPLCGEIMKFGAQYNLIKLDEGELSQIALENPALYAEHLEARKGWEGRRQYFEANQ